MTSKPPSAFARGLLSDGGAGALVKNKPATIVVAVATVMVIAWLDHLSGTRLSLTPLYVIPVATIAWWYGGAWGRACAAFAGFAQAVANVITTASAPSPGIIAWNAFMLFALSTVAGEVLVRLHESLGRESDLARTDSLTGVANARAFHEIATLELERSRRYGHAFTLACLDLDHFKDVNDALGHAAGDRLLVDVGKALQDRLRRVDTVARLGGDEFILMLPETSAAPALFALEQIRHLLADLTLVYGPKVRASIGAVTFAEAPSSVTEMMRAADLAMYRAKARGRDRVESVTLPQEIGLLKETEAALDTFGRNTTAGFEPAAEPTP
jgi:diguanylate cyclase (GGDEF)-like protein